MIVTLVLLGQVLELRARSATSGAIRALLGLAPKTARRVREDGGEEDVPSPRCARAIVCACGPASACPSTALLEGESAVDESMVTGEPIPVAKAPDSRSPAAP